MVNKNAAIAIELMVGLVILGIVMVLILSFFVPALANALGLSGILGNTGFSNTEVVVNSCELSCGKRNATEFCNSLNNNGQKWKLGDGRRIEGSCYAISQVNVSIFGGVKGCSKAGVQCGNAEPAVCYKDKKVIDCSSQLFLG